LIHKASGSFVPAPPAAVVEAIANRIFGAKSSAPRMTTHPDAGMVIGGVKVTTLIPNS
jgi:hypothetical protein